MNLISYIFMIGCDKISPESVLNLQAYVLSVENNALVGNDLRSDAKDGECIQPLQWQWIGAKKICLIKSITERKLKHLVSACLAKSANHNAQNRALIKVSLRIFDTPSIAIPLRRCRTGCDLASKFPHPVRNRVWFACAWSSICLRICSRKVKRYKIESRCSLTTTSHQEHISQYLTSHSLPLSSASEMAPFKAGKDNNMDVYILPTTETRDLVEKISANPYYRYATEAVLDAVCSLYLFTSCLI
jgi:hypothetical protein